MIVPNKEEALNKATKMLCHWLECEETQLRSSEILREAEDVGRIDAVIEIRQTKFLMEYKRSGKVSSVATGIDQLERAGAVFEKEAKVLVVPYMFNLGRERCEAAGISWLDLSGNADIKAPPIRIFVQGLPNQFKRPGRAPNIFAPKSSRVSRWLLYHPQSAFLQSELAELTDLGEGYVSKIVRALEDQRLVDRDEAGKVTVGDQALLLDAWLEAYDFHKHSIYKGHIPARSGPELLDRLSNYFSREGLEYASTGLGAAWLYTQFAGFRMASLYVDKALSPDKLAELDFREGEAGSNTWLIVPAERSVFWEAEVINGVSCVHPIQAYLDLGEHPERAEEAKGELRRLILRPKG